MPQLHPPVGPLGGGGGLSLRARRLPLELPGLPAEQVLRLMGVGLEARKSSVARQRPSQRSLPITRGSLR